MRVFIAAFLSAASQQMLAESVQGLALPGYRLVPPENLHVTLRFLGQLDSEQLSRLRQCLQEQRVAVTEPMSGRVVGIRAFPSRRQARVLGLAVDSDNLLETLAVQLSRVLRADFGDPDRAFHAHVTFARLAGRGSTLRELPIVDVPGPIQLERFGAYESKTLRDGAIYERLFPVT